MGPVRQNPIQRTVSLFIRVWIALCTIVAHNIAQNRPDSFPPYPPDDHHCSDDVYLREGGRKSARFNDKCSSYLAQVRRLSTRSCWVVEVLRETPAPFTEMRLYLTFSFQCITTSPKLPLLPFPLSGSFHRWTRLSRSPFGSSPPPVLEQNLWRLAEQVFLQPGCSSCRPTICVNAPKGTQCTNPNQWRGLIVSLSTTGLLDGRGVAPLCRPSDATTRPANIQTK